MTILRFAKVMPFMRAEQEKESGFECGEFEILGRHLRVLNKTLSLGGRNKGRTRPGVTCRVVCSGRSRSQKARKQTGPRRRETPSGQGSWDQGLGLLLMATMRTKIKCAGCHTAPTALIMTGRANSKSS